jgi:hypothetical protein
MSAVTRLVIPERRPRLVSIFSKSDGLIVAIRQADGKVRRLHISTLDSPSLELLNDSDRGRVRSALLSVHRGDDGGGRAA